MSSGSTRIRSAETFHVLPWSWDAVRGELSCHYAHGAHRFTEVVGFDWHGTPGPPLARAFDVVAVVAGTSYYKLAAAQRIEIAPAWKTPAWEPFVATLYDEGMREFSVTNGLPIPFVPEVTVRPAPGGGRARPAAPPAVATPAPLVPMGGGRDSLIVASALRDLRPLLLVVGDNEVVAAQAAALGATSVVVQRTLDPRMLMMGRSGAMNGHVPVTAINSAIAVAAAVIHRRTDVVMSNERSADEPTRTVGGVAVNHQYSKSGAFEVMLRGLLDVLGCGVGYFSALRPYGELAISRAIGAHWDTLPPFLSCNRAFVRSPGDRATTWCARCAKCTFVFLGLAPFVPRPTLAAMFGRDLLAEPDGVAQVRDLLVGAERSFDCIGTPAEVAVAVHLAADGAWGDVPSLGALAGELAAPSPAELEAMLAAHPVPEPIPPGYAPLLRRVLG